MKWAAHSMWRWMLSIACGLVVLAVVSIPLLTVEAWVGRKTLAIEVHVIDGAMASAVEGAQVTLFRGPRTPFEGRNLPESESFSGVLPEAIAASAVTDLEGRCRFTHSFHAAGTRGLLRDSGYVETKEVWLRVSASGGAPAIVPLDRQSILPRDIHDETPLWMTVVLSRCAAE
jgi:hypothetical protein